MGFLDVVGLVGALLLVLALAPAYIRRLPVAASAVYMLAGVVLGPVGFDLLYFDARHAQPWLEHVTEVTVVVSLFIGGLKMRLPLRHPAWKPALLLAVPGMLLTIIGIAAFGHLVFGLGIGASILLGAVLAPTDPVLASAVAVNDAADKDRMRYGLSGEAGLNDGLAFPFVVFALLWSEHGGMGGWIGGWAMHRLVWAIPAALVIGYLAGFWLGRLAVWLRGQHPDTAAPNAFLTMALIALAYYATELVGAWGFLSAFAAGVGLRHREIRMVHAPHEAGAHDRPINPINDAVSYDRPPAENLLGERTEQDTVQPPAKAAGIVVFDSMSFGDALERLLEVLIVVLVGVGLARHWDARAIPLALALFFVIRPLSAYLLLKLCRTTNPQRWLMGWFGVRGIGSLYYLSYALSDGLPSQTAADAAGLTFSVVAISILVHGVSIQPLLERYTRTLRRRSAE